MNKIYKRTRNALLASLCCLIALPAVAFDYLPTFHGELVTHRNYSLSYIEDHEVAEWVAHKLTRAMVNGSASRTNDFRTDPLVSTGSATARAFRGSGYDRGHLAPAGDMKLNREVMSESFFMSNMAPQRPDFNRGIWRELEEQVRRWVRSDGELYVITGPVLRSALPQLSPEGVSIPEEFYKIILDIDHGSPRIIAFLFRNEGSRAELQDFVVTVDRLEELTGIDFFPALDDFLEESLEANIMTEAWSFSR